MNTKKLLNELKDPMVMILVMLLVFLTFGTAISGCVGKKKVIEIILNSNRTREMSLFEKDMIYYKVSFLCDKTIS